MTSVAGLKLILKSAVHLQRSLMHSNSTRFRCGSLISLYSTIRTKTPRPLIYLRLIIALEQVSIHEWIPP
jgi:hypothetical protein